MAAIDARHQAQFEEARALWAAGEGARARPIFAELARALPDLAEVQAAYGVCLYETGAIVEAGQALERALALDPDHAIAAYNLAHVQLTLGDYAQGFRLYERRWASFPRPDWMADPALAWDGQAFAGTLLVVAEQGFGDVLQFARFLPLAAARVGRLITVVPKELVRLFAGIKGVAQVIAGGEPLPPFDRLVPMLSLPHRLGTDLETLPPVPYLQKPARTQRRGFRPAVGLVWGGRAGTAQERARACPFDALARRLAPIIGARFASLQMGEPWTADLARWPGPSAIEDWTVGIEDFQDTAWRLANLELLVTVDTAIAHLAGALGVPTLVLVGSVPHWVWGIAGNRTPWYPSLRLFRVGPEGWERTLDRLAQAIEDFLWQGFQ